MHEIGDNTRNTLFIQEPHEFQLIYRNGRRLKESKDEINTRNTLFIQEPHDFTWISIHYRNGWRLKKSKDEHSKFMRCKLGFYS